MAKQSQTELAVLAALSIEPMTGYALREAITTELGSFWSESFGQIYPALARLRDAGLVEVETEAAGNPARHRLTSAGRGRLLELLRESPEAQAPRNGLLLRLFFGEALGPDACRDLIEQARERAQSQLAALAVARSEATAEPNGKSNGESAGARHRPYWLMTISAGEHAARAQLAWVAECEAMLRALPD